MLYYQRTPCACSSLDPLRRLVVYGSLAFASVLLGRVKQLGGSRLEALKKHRWIMCHRSHDVRPQLFVGYSCAWFVNELLHALVASEIALQQALVVLIEEVVSSR